MQLTVASQGLLAVARFCAHPSVAAPQLNASSMIFRIWASRLPIFLACTQLVRSPVMSLMAVFHLIQLLIQMCLVHSVQRSGFAMNLVTVFFILAPTQSMFLMSQRVTVSFQQVSASPARARAPARSLIRRLLLRCLLSARPKLRPKLRLKLKVRRLSL